MRVSSLLTTDEPPDVPHQHLCPGVRCCMWYRMNNIASPEVTGAILLTTCSYRPLVTYPKLLLLATKGLYLCLSGCWLQCTLLVACALLLAAVRKRSLSTAFTTSGCKGRNQRIPCRLPCSPVKHRDKPFYPPHHAQSRDG